MVGLGSMGYGIQSMLKEGHRHLSGLEEAVLKNIDACRELSAITRTSLGPNGEFRALSRLPPRRARCGFGVGVCAVAWGARGIWTLERGERARWVSVRPPDCGVGGMVG